ncbi:IpaD/SipD/SspD family type III secretion system needle tip protein [Pectobacterium carotovorum]|nr:IpaD/SipD/SspD family type III secretion system needle tip protein [Pectobacterium carotovorum]
MIGKSLSENGVDIDSPNLEHGNVGEGAGQKNNVFNRIGMVRSDVLESKVLSHDKEYISTAENIKQKINNDNLMAKYANSQLYLARINIEKTAGDEISHANENGKRNGEITTSTSYAELWAVIANAIQTIKEDYVDFYADLMKQYTDMYEAYNEHVQKASSEAVSAGKDGNTVAFDQKKMEDGYTAFDAYVAANSPAGEVKNWADMTPEEKNDMRVTLEPAYKIVEVEDEDGNCHGSIEFNLDQYDKTVKNSYPAAKNQTGVYEPSTSSYQAWLATFNSTSSALQSNMQSFAQRYSQANNTFDNLNKVLSGAISALGESAKDVFKAL